MALRLTTRRFFCDDSQCSRLIFSEQLPNLACRHARSTPRLNRTLAKVGMECGGEPGQRLCGQLGITTSGDTILRRLRATPLYAGHTGNIIGVDDFALRRGQCYGTIVVDHESGGVIDLLADRTSATLQTWLTSRPIAPTVVTRDRFGAYANAITTAVPEAVQVADRWHLLANCRDALIRLLDRCHWPITQAMAVVRERTPGLDPNVLELAPKPFPTENPLTVIADAVVPLSRNQQQSADRRARRVARYEQVLELKGQGLSQRAIAKQIKMNREHVRKLIHADGFPERAKVHRTRQVDRYVEHLRARWAEGNHNVRELTLFIRPLGYTGESHMVRRCVASWRTPVERLRLSGPKHPPQLPMPLKLQRPSSDRLSWLMVKDDMVRWAGETDLLDELNKSSEPIRVACELARSFGKAIRTRNILALTAWREAALQTTSAKEMKGFARGLVKNWTEVSAAVERPWSNGRTEGHVNRLKLIKRKMYGRANLDLLRIRVLGSGP